MLFLISIAFLLKHYGTQAVPLPVSATTSFPFDTPIIARDNPSDGSQSRTVLDILWSCLATTFACTWVSVHPNVPWCNEGKWTLLRRRIYLMFFSILAPEFMIVWAFKQWRGAVMIRESVNEATRQAFPDPQNPRRDSWTTAHGHLLQMGGFRLIATQRENLFCKGVGPVLRSLLVKDIDTWQSELGKVIMITSLRSEDSIPKIFHYRHETSEGFWSNDYAPDNELNDNIWEGVLTLDSLKQLLSENLITFPTVSEDEIDDRSKGDALSKGIALLQLTWFIVQIISRAVQGLVISDLELTTAALAGLNSVMYIFWWSKPRDVRFPVVIRTKGVEKLLAERTEVTIWSFSDQKEFDFRKHLWTSMTTPVKDGLSDLHSFLVYSLKTIRNIPSYLANAIKVLPHHLHYYLYQIYRIFLRAIENVKGDKSVESKHAIRYSSVVVNPELHSRKENMSRTRQIYTSGAKTVVYWFAFFFSLPAYVISFGIIIPIGQILSSGGNQGTLPMLFDRDEQIRVFSMMFYSEDAEIKPLLSTASIAGALFGVVHCLAWHFSFPSYSEQIMWRTASLGIIGACTLSLVGTNLNAYINDIDIDEVDGLLRIMGYNFLFFLYSILWLLTAVVYPVFRLMLLVLAVTSLRSLPPSAFDTVQWIEFVPHI